MASATKPSWSGLGALGGMAAKLALKTTLSLLQGNRGIMEYLAAEAYHDETGHEFTKLNVSDRALWVNRVQSIMRAISDKVSL